MSFVSRKLRRYAPKHFLLRLFTLLLFLLLLPTILVLMHSGVPHDVYLHDPFVGVGEETDWVHQGELELVVWTLHTADVAEGVMVSVWVIWRSLNLDVDYGIFGECDVAYAGGIDGDVCVARVVRY